MNKVSLYPDFAALPPAHADLFEQAGNTSFSLSLDWFKLLAAHGMAADARPRIYAIESIASGAPLLIFPALCRKTRPHHLEAFANFYSARFEPITLLPEAEMQNGLRTLLQAIAAETPHWATLDVRPLAQDETAFKAIEAALRNAGFLTQAYFCHGNWYCPIAGRSYAQYFDALPSQLRSTLARKARQSERMGGVSFAIHDRMEGIEAAIAAFEQVYRASWKQPEPFPSFVPELIRACAVRGWLRLGICRVHGEPAAAQLWIIVNRVASIYKLAYDEKFARLSLGSALTAYLMRHVIDIDRVHEVDYLTGDEPYKRDWMSHRRERWGIMAFNPRSVRGILAAARHLGGRQLRNWMRGRGRDSH